MKPRIKPVIRVLLASLAEVGKIWERQVSQSEKVGVCGHAGPGMGISALSSDIK